MRKYNILISCYSGEKDSGDETMLLCIREQLTSVCKKQLSIAAFSNDPDISNDFNDDIEFIYSGRHGLRQPNRHGLDALSWIPKMVIAIKKCDILITGGGTILYDESNRFFVPFWFIKILLAQLFKKPTVFYGIGVGPLNRHFSRFLMNTIASRMSFISLRGVESQKWISKFNINPKKVFLTADPAVTIYPAEYSQILNYFDATNIHINKKYVVLVLREWFKRPNRGLEEAQSGISSIVSYDDYINEMTMFCEWIINNQDIGIIMMPMGTLPPCDDREVLYRVYNRLKKRGVSIENVAVMPDITDSRIMVGIIAKSEMVVTGRFHGLIYANTQMIPAIGLAYTEKYYDYYNYIGLSDYIISMNDLNFNRLKDLCTKVNINREIIINKLSREMPIQRKMARKNALLVKHILENKR